jgi:hypothetical protein
VSVAGGGTGAQLLAQGDFGDIGDGDRQAVAMGDDQAAQILQPAHLSGNAYQQLFVIAFEIARTLVGVVALDRLREIVEAQSVRQQPRGVGLHMELLAVATDGIHFGDAGHLQQLRADHPVLDAAQRGGVVGLPIGLACVGIGLDRVEKDLAEAGGDGAHRRFHVVRQTAACLLQPFVDQLSREVDVGAIGKGHGHLRQAVAR